MNNALKQLAGAEAPANSTDVITPSGGTKSATVTAAIIGAVATLVASGISWYSQHRANKESERLMDKENQWNLDMWNRQNVYNTPSSQISRLKDAGINPALIYGNGIMNEAGSGAPAAAAPNIKPNLQIDPLTAAEIGNITADTELKKSQARTQESLTREKDISNALADINLRTWQTMDKEGLIEEAKRAGLEQDVISRDLSEYQVIEAAWDFLIYTGYPESEQTGEYGASRFSYFRYDPERLKNAQKEFVGTQSANIAVQEAARVLANKQKEFNGNTGEIMKEINDAASKGELWAKIVKVALFILEQRSGQPGISLNFSPSRSKTYNNNQSTSYDEHFHNTKVFNAPFN